MPEPPTVDFDHHNRNFHADRHARWAELRECPVAHNPNHGGFWVVSGYEEVAEVSRDAETFSSRHEPQSTDGIDYLGIAGVPRPAAVPTSGIAEVEGPVHTALRRAMNPYLMPKAIAALEPLMEAATTWFIDQRIGEGEIDLVGDLTNPVPSILTMELVGLPLDGWRHYADLFHNTIAYAPGSDEFDRAVAAIPDMLTELRDVAEARRRAPAGDLLTDLVHLELPDGRHLSDDELASVLWNLIGGGLDTTTSLTSLALSHLDEHPELRRRLIDEPELLPSATEEFLRYFSVNESLTRTVTRDTSLGDQELGRGDHLLLSWLSANRDRCVFSDADSVVVDRAPNPHLAFGVGPHRCIGMHMARTMFMALVRQVLERMPDYAVDRDATQFYAGNPELNGVVSMPATFTPGPVVGPAERPF